MKRFLWLSICILILAGLAGFSSCGAGTDSFLLPSNYSTVTTPTSTPTPTPTPNPTPNPIPVPAPPGGGGITIAPYWP